MISFIKTIYFPQGKLGVKGDEDLRGLPDGWSGFCVF